ncbi:HAMP domain-containing histidine kinase [Cobetia marina]|uniref:histidine kinase n=1 Tax=Cobetia marina TaxID=28258 RepID=A0ABU9GC19_COBMA|nr:MULTISPECIES: HAMP domain-containing sensor histidine kinase [Cobetia]MDA5563007.1 HAMP domain-containing sensor histidine kinase [Cobetia sp. MMG027]MDH2292083.1 HAMP domain-containing sensor histidine kinase [Cobetia sp. 10Alg 146]MDH2373313.1 HAMP domain-containing sensor histidine kinase [Cobetia sp. 3AK]MDI6003228.1 HAMP domain-containing sensor histidine kinase [Cobetia pacifica]MDN2655670.1 HAMP domain-containing sensor histidine kinase [Cobetia sp. 14N.309.X.WAT.E.A4]
MASKVTRHWRPRSLLQLVLMAFMVVMLPIAVLMFQAGQALSELSELADVSARQAVDQTRRARTLTNLAVEMERSARQYAVLENPDLMKIYADKASAFRELLDEQARLLGEGDPRVSELKGSLSQLERMPEMSVAQVSSHLEDFGPFSIQASGLLNSTRELVDARIEGIRARASQVKTQLWWQTAALVSISLLLMLFFTWLIIRPIRQLERRINGLGSGTDREGPLIKGPAELVQLGERLDWLAARLDELEEQKQQFLRHMSHELKTPLASIREGTGLLIDEVAGPLSPHQMEILGLLDDSSKELQKLIEQLLDYNLLQHNQGLERSRFDVHEVFKEVLSKHRLALEKKGMRVHLPPASLSWEADRPRTGRILDNLISNAIAYGEDGGDLWLRARKERRQLVIEVANSGEPIAPKDRDHLFQPFYQGAVKRKGPLKGSGIGLSVAADSARAQFGQLALVEDAKADVCFRLTLPTPSRSPSSGQEGEQVLLGGDSAPHTT